MILTRINIALSVLLLITVAIAASLNVDHGQPNLEFLPEMKRSAASQAYSANAVLPNGRTLQPPVTGTIARGDLPLYYTATKEDAERAGEELRNPFSPDNKTTPSSGNTDTSQPPETTAATAADPAEAGLLPPPDPGSILNTSIQRGAKIYGVFCVSCHGASGAGDGPVAKRGFPPPPPLTTGKSAQMKDGQLFHILTYGQGSMSPLASQLNRHQRWDAINYVRSLQQGAQLSAPDARTAAPDQPTDEQARQDTAETPSSEEQGDQP